ncbi:Ubiquitin-associated protein 2 [Nibea albiflora]|uniref:Ubiquitin-associated protein 2 n=1 Tax=Nibea albiflora TaxID=240163 RepID=A0ACB7FCV8_NIBAL|nr:Ubiquitin-associated protein 2 [Nibea albiflora]
MERLKRYVCHSQGKRRERKEREREEEEMALCLYECLRAVGLQRHYARFTSVGVCRVAHLSGLTMEDYHNLGIRSMEDRTRLFHLVQMVKTLDLESLEYEDRDEDNDCDHGDEGYAIADSSITYDGCGEPDEDEYDDVDEKDDAVSSFSKPSRVCRRLDFSCETSDHHQKLLPLPVGTVHVYTSHNRNNKLGQSKGSAISVQLDLDTESPVVCSCKGNNKHRLDVHHQSNHRTGANSKPDVVEGISINNSHARLSPKRVSSHSPKPRPATVASNSSSHKLNGYKDRKGISWKEKLHAEISCDTASEHTTKATPVYESKRTAGYNYGLPLSSPPSPNKKQPDGQRISVCVRKRPLTHAECRRGEADVVTTPSGECVTVHESKEAVDLTQYILQHRFYFDQVFGEESSNEDVYRKTAYPLVQHMLNGGKATCFAYGQTGAGKTHTMLGSSPGRPGLYALAVRDIFAQLYTTHTHSPLLVYVSFFEIYCGQLYDLLDHRKRLFAREDGQKVVHIAGLQHVRVDSVSSLLEVISQGTEERTQGVSGVNPLSSRSHALLQIQLRGPNQQIAGSVKELRGQGGLRGGKRGKTIPSPKRNLSNGSTSRGGSSVAARGKSPPKKPKLGRQKEAFSPASPTSRLATEGAVLCSTPKKDRGRGEETGAIARDGFGLEQITPIRGSLGTVSALACHGLEDALDAYGVARVVVRTDGYRGQSSSSSSGEICLQTGTSPGYSKNNDEVDHGDSGGVSEDWRVSQEGMEAGFGPDRGKREKRRSQKARGEGEVRVKREDWKSAKEEGGGGERRWAWMPTTGTEQADRVTGAGPAEVEASVSGDSDVGEEGLDASNVPSDGLWSTEEQEEADGYDLLSTHNNNNSNSLFNHHPVDPTHQRAPAERPLSPPCEHTNTLLTPNKLGEHTRRTANILPLPLRNVQQGVPPSSCKEKEPWLATNANRRECFSSQSATLPPRTPVAQNGRKIPAEPLNLSENPAHTHSHPQAKAKTTVLAQGENSTDSLSYIMDPLSISLLDVDQQVATASFLQGEQSNTSLCLLEYEREEDKRRDAEKEHLTCAKMANKNVRNEDEEFRLWRVVQAHWEQLEEMESLCRKEGTLLCQQPDMIFLFCTYIVLYILYMMTSVVSNQARGTRDRTLPTTTQTTQPQKQIQATAEQIRLAQMIYDKNDADFEDKVKQLIEVTGKTQDECMVALHDCNEDVNRAINFLLESTSDTNSWETVGKKRSLGKEGGPSEIKESREKRGGEREASRGRGGSNRRGRGISRGREGRIEENGFEVAPGERGGDRGRRGRGRAHVCFDSTNVCDDVPITGQGVAVEEEQLLVTGSPPREWGKNTTFNPAEYTANSGARQETWEGDGNEPAEGTGTWGGNLEDWTSEDWNEDLSETKVFTASSAPANHVTPGHNVDLASLLPKAGVGVPGSMDSDLGVVDGPSAEDLGQSLVFTNSHHNGRTATHSYAHATANSYAHAASAGTTYAHAALSSVLGSGFGSLNAPKHSPASDMRTPDQLNGPRLGQRASQTLATTSNSAVSKDAGPPPIQNPVPACSPSVEAKAQRVDNGPVTAQHLEMKLQPEPSAVLSQLAQRQQSSILSTTEPLGLSQLHAPQVPTPPGHESSMAPVRDGASPGMKLSGMEPPITEPPQRQLKTQRRRVPPPTKIPSSAVEMPGSADISGLNVQFGALDFGSEAASGSVDMAQAESVREQAPAQASAPAAMPVPTAVPTQQPQSSLFSKPGSMSEHMSSLPTLPSAVSDPSFPSPSLGLPSATPSPSLGLPSAATPPSSTAPTAASRVDNSGPRSLPPHLGFAQSKDVPSASALTNGYSGMKTQSTQDTTSSTSRTVKTDSPIMTSDSGPSHHIPSPAVTPSHSTPIPSLSSHVTNAHSSGSALATSSSLTISNEESSSSGNLHAFSSSSTSQAVNPSPSVPQAVSSSTTNGLHPSGAPGLTPNGTNASLSAAGGRTAPLLTNTSGKAPPNLAQGVPPLLANQYIMGPGGLLPAYPQIYGYEDLQMLQSRLPMDYYGVTFPGTTATMPGRDGLANNPYSGEATKFGRNDSSSPAPPTSLSTAGVQSQPQQAPQAGTQGQGQGQSQGQQTQNQAFLNPPLPPGYGYTGLPYYAGVPGVPSAFQYGPTVFVPPASAKQPAMGLANPSNQYHQQHQPSYGQHAYGTAFDDLSQAHGEYNKGGYGGSAQSQAKSAGSGPGKAPGLSGSGTSVPDMGGSIYSKTQSFDKQGFHTGTPPPFSLPSALGGTGPLNPGGAPGYAPAPFLHILPPHQQPHSQLLHHHLTQDGQGGPGQRSQSSSMQQKTQGSKSSYGSSPYWAN